MKAILIDPNTKSVARIDINKDARLSDFFGEKPRLAMKFPKGDILFAGVQERAEAFIIGGSRPIAGPGLIVGRRTGPGERSPALVRLDDVVTMVRWTAIELRPGPPAAVRAIVIDPEQGLIQEVIISAHKLAVMNLLGGEIGSYMRVPGNDQVFSPAFGSASPWCWRKDDLTFSSRSVIVGRDSEKDYCADVVTSVENLRTSVEFRAGPTKVVGSAMPTGSPRPIGRPRRRPRGRVQSTRESGPFSDLNTWSPEGRDALLTEAAACKRRPTK